MTSVGIDAIEIRTGSLQLDLANTFAAERNEDPAKYTKGLGLQTISLPDVYEDIVTMGANAAHRLMERKGLTPDDIGRIDVATESAFDNSKPVSTYIAGCLEQLHVGNFHHANKGERKFACISGTQALSDAYNWIRAGRNRGRSAIVIATDTALYERGDPGESTQGAGAVAMLVSENPAVATLSPEQGIGSADETDFLKPNQQFPSVDGKRSMQVYLARMREALEDYERVADASTIGDFAYVPFHTPFPGMVRKAAPLGYRHAIRGTARENELAKEIGWQPLEEDFTAHEHYTEAIQAYMDDLTDTDHYQTWYTNAITPTLSFSERVGNWYTGSVHLARASALKHAADTGRSLTGKQLLVASYGSGAQAEIHVETIQDGWKEEIQHLTIEEQIDTRYDLSYEDYEAIHEAHTYDEPTNATAFTQPDGEFVFDGWGQMNERTYDYVN